MLRILSALSLFSALVLTGCGLAPTEAVTGPQVEGVTLTGSVHGGQQPVTGSGITMYAAGKTGYGSTSRKMYNTITDATGGFTLSPLGIKAYTCNAGDEVYLVATGGNPGLSPTVRNANLVMMAALGPCSALTTSTYININEVSTAAAVYALAPFISTTKNSSGGYNPAAIGTSATNAVGLANAFATVNNLVALSSGAALAVTPGGNGIPEQTLLNSIANFLAVCANSNGTDSNCTNAQAAAGSPAPDMFSDMTTIALAPYNNVSAILSMPAPTAPFQPALTTTTRNDLSMSVGYTGVGNYPYFTQADAVGNIWVTDGNGLEQFSPVGVYQRTTSPALPGSTLCARIDGNGTIWALNGVTNEAEYFDANGVLEGMESGAAVTDIVDGCTTDSLNGFDFASGHRVYNVTKTGTNSNQIEADANGSAVFSNAVASDPSQEFMYSGTYPYYLNYNQICSTEGISTLPDLQTFTLASSPDDGSCANDSNPEYPLRYPTWNGMGHFVSIYFNSNGGDGAGVGFQLVTSNPKLEGFQSTQMLLNGTPASGGVGYAGGISVDGAEHYFIASRYVVGLFQGLNTTGAGNGGPPATVLAPTGLIPDSFVPQALYGDSGTALPLSGALDASGSYWFPLNTSHAANTPALVQIIGIGAPTVMPFGAQAVNNTTGQRP